MKHITKDYKEEFNKLKQWVNLYPIEAAMRIDELENQNKILLGAISKYRTSLKFYAEEENYIYRKPEVKWGESMTQYSESNIVKDSGRLAQSVLDEEDSLNYSYMD